MGKYRSTLCKLARSTRRLTCGFVNGFDRAGMLQACDRLLKPERKPRRGELASSLALAFGTALCLIAIESQVVQIDTAKAEPKKSIITVTPKAYAKALLNDDKQYACILTLYTKESNWRHDAVGNLNGTKQVYGIPQLKNKIMLNKNPLEQVTLGVKYIKHKYGVTTKGVPNACKALHHLKTKGWH
jgi:hypothetical protein